MKTSPLEGYLSYLLRLWQAGDDPRASWRASLESPMTGSRQNFASLDDLFTHLKNLVEAADQENHVSNARLTQGEPKN